MVVNMHIKMHSIRREKIEINFHSWEKILVEKVIESRGLQLNSLFIDWEDCTHHQKGSQGKVEGPMVTPCNGTSEDGDGDHMIILDMFCLEFTSFYIS